MKISAILAAIVLVSASPAAAETIVNRCGSDVEAGGQNLANALSIGGRIRFACPGGAATIAVTRDYELPPGVELEGEGRIVLDAQSRQLRLFHVTAGSISLRNLRIRNVRTRPTPFRLRPSVLEVGGGELRLENVAITNSESPVTTLHATVVGSNFSDNKGSALYVSGIGAIRDTQFRDNDAALGLRGGLVEKVTFTNNRVSGLSVQHPVAAVDVVGNWFRGNSGSGAAVLSQRSNGASGSQTIRFRRNVFEDNMSATGGGAISVIDTVATAPPVVQPALSQFPPSRFEFSYDRFARNRGQGAGAIDARLEHTLGMRIYGGIFVSNTADSRAGAIAWTNASVDILHSVFVGNSAPDGAAVFADYQAAGARWLIANSLFTRNSADPDGGVIAIGPVELFNVTVARNNGIGFTGDVHGSTPDRPLIANSILSENIGGNCRGIAADRFRGKNLQFGADDCEGADAADPMLDGFLVPQLGSPALAMGDIEICRSKPVSGKDIVFQSRALQDICAVGAFEYAPKDRIISLFEPSDE